MKCPQPRLMLLLSLTLLATTCGAAKDIYIAQVAGASADGSSCATALGVAWLNVATHWGTSSTQVAPGDTVHLCGTITQMIEPQADGTASAPITILFESCAKISAPTLWNSTEGYGSGINLDNRHWFVVDGGSSGVIEATDNGTPGAYGHSDNISGVDANNAGNITVRHLTIRGMYARTPGSNDANKYGCGSWGINMTGSNVFDSNTVIDANCGVQWNMTQAGGSLVVSNNTIQRISWGFASQGGGTVAVSFFGNTLSDGYVWSGQIATGDGHFHNDPFHIWTTSVATTFRPLLIYNNWVQGNWGDNTTGAIFLECQGAAVDCPAVIYNNIISASTGFTNGAVALKYVQGAKIFNNLFHGSGTAIAIENATNGDTSTPSTQIDVENNVFYQVDTALAASDNSSFGTVNANAYWQSGYGPDARAITSDPKLNLSTFLPQTGSPLIDAGISLASYFTSDRRGITRPQGKAWDVGPYELVPGSTTPAKPGAPSLLTATGK